MSTSGFNILGNCHFMILPQITCIMYLCTRIGSSCNISLYHWSYRYYISSFQTRCIVWSINHLITAVVLLLLWKLWLLHMFAKYVFHYFQVQRSFNVNRWSSSMTTNIKNILIRKDVYFPSNLTCTRIQRIRWCGRPFVWIYTSTAPITRLLISF